MDLGQASADSLAVHSQAELAWSGRQCEAAGAAPTGTSSQSYSTMAAACKHDSMSLQSKQHASCAPQQAQLLCTLGIHAFPCNGSKPTCTGVFVDMCSTAGMICPAASPSSVAGAYAHTGNTASNEDTYEGHASLLGQQGSPQQGHRHHKEGPPPARAQEHSLHASAGVHKCITVCSAEKGKQGSRR